MQLNIARRGSSNVPAAQQVLRLTAEAVGMSGPLGPSQVLHAEGTRLASIRAFRLGEAAATSVPSPGPFGREADSTNAAAISGPTLEPRKQALRNAAQRAWAKTRLALEATRVDSESPMLDEDTFHPSLPTRPHILRLRPRR
jgi:hypothetical protein